MAASSSSTRFAYGMAIGGTTGATPPMRDAMVGTSSSNIVSALSAFKAAGVRVIWKFVGGPNNYRNADLSFSMSKWTAAMTDAHNQMSAAQAHAFVRDGTLIGNWVMDDSKGGSTIFGGVPPTMDEHDTMCQFSKSVWSQVPCIIRVDSSYLAAHKSHWTYADAGWAQWHKKWGNAATWFANNVADGRAVGLGLVVGFNLLDGGSGKTAPWNVERNPGSNLFGMSPMEIDAVRTAIQSSATYAICNFGWTEDNVYDTLGWYDRSDIQAALQRMADFSAPRVAGPINWRSTGTSGSTVTVTGNWGLRGLGTIARGGNLASLTVPVPVPAPPLGDLLTVQAYSRDSSRIPVLPLGWSEAERIEGAAAQGGVLTLFYRLATGSDTDLTLTWSGAGSSGVNVMAQMVAFSANTTIQAGLLSTTGSAHSWPQGSSNMGPVSGLGSSAVSDAMVLICAAKAADFGNGDPPGVGTMSATTADTETWTRLFYAANTSGNKSGMFMDMAALTGQPSITTKSWSQLTTVTSSSSQAGCGFMVSFRPASVVSGQPPAITTDLQDVTVTVGSLLSFVLDSTGSTPITYSKVSGPSNVTLNASTGLFNFTPLSATTYNIVLQATNSFGTDAAGFNVFGASSSGTNNVAPVIINPGNKTVAAHDLLSFVVIATDADGDPITFRLEGAPVGTFLDSNSGQFVWIPSGEQGPGVYPMIIVANDGRVDSKSTFTVTVTDTPWTRERGRGLSFGATDPVGNQFRRI